MLVKHIFIRNGSSTLKLDIYIYIYTICSPHFIVDSSSNCLNHSNAQFLEGEGSLLTSQGKELLSVLESIQNLNDPLNSRNRITITSEGRLSGYVCSEIALNLYRKILINAEIKILEKSLNFAPVERKINKPELRSDFEEFYGKVRANWHFQNQPTPDFNQHTLYQV